MIALALGSFLLLVVANVCTATLGIYAGLRLLGFRPQRTALLRIGLLAGSANTMVHILYRLLLRVPLGTHALLMTLVDILVVRWQTRLRWATASVASLLGMILLTSGALLSAGAMAILGVNMARTETTPIYFFLGMVLELSPLVGAALLLWRKDVVLLTADESRGEGERGMWLLAAVLGQSFIILWLTVSTLARSTEFTTVSIPMLLSLSLLFVPVVTYLLAELDRLMRQERAALKAELELARAQREAATAVASREAIARMAAGVAHDVRGPLTPVKNYLAMIWRLVSDSPNAARIQPLLEHSRELIEDIEDTLDDFIYLSRPPSTPKELIDLHALLERLRREMAPTAGAAGIGLDLVLQASRPLLLGRTNRLYRVFLNLVQNAIEACRDGGAVTISTFAADPGTVGIRITDTGMGIPPENLPEIFQPFFTTKRKGTGLGLAIVNNIVDEHEGTVTVQSRPGEGTTVTVTLPTYRDVEAKPVTHAPKRSGEQSVVEGAQLAEPGLERGRDAGELDPSA